LLLAARVYGGEIAVIVAADSPMQSLNAKEISDLYLGRYKAGSGERALVFDHPRDSDIRHRFYRQLNGMELRRVNAYWARLQFSGDTPPPVTLRDSEEIAAAVSRNRLAIGYIDAAAVIGDVRIVMVLRE
jgi:ABC-type phosphate transport system substrate-binding protein